MNKIKAPQEAHDLWTALDADRHLGLDCRLIYQAVELGIVHPVRPVKRLLYPRWELEALKKRIDDGQTLEQIGRQIARLYWLERRLLAA